MPKYQGVLVRKIGGSIVVTVPKNIANLAGFKLGDEVILKARHGKIEVTLFDPLIRNLPKKALDTFADVPVVHEVYVVEEDEPTVDDLNLLDQISDAEEQHRHQAWMEGEDGT